jgi:hypothetical protein
LFYFDSNVFKNILVLNKRTNLGKIYFENKYIIITKSKKLYDAWLTKKKGTSWGKKYVLKI